MVINKTAKTYYSGYRFGRENTNGFRLKSETFPMRNSVHVTCMLQAITCMLPVTCMLHDGFHNMHVGLHVTLM